MGRSFKSEKVCQILEQLFAQRGTPGALCMDNAPFPSGGYPEFVAMALRGLCSRKGINGDYIEPGKPWQNGHAESFHARLRDEFLNREVFLSVLDAQVKLAI